MLRTTELKDLREKSISDLQEEVLSARKEQFQIRLTRSAGEVIKPHRDLQLRKRIARIKTLIGEKLKAQAKAQE